jgi:hypothetical protein
MPTELEGHRVFLTAAVGDVVKSSALLLPQIEHVNTLIADFLAELRKSGKFVNVKHNGDGFTLFSQDPVAVAESVLHIRHQFRTHDWQSCGLAASPALRIGIDAGIATIGRPDDVGYEAIGDGIIKAARIEPVVTPDEIWCSEVAAASLRSDSRLHLGTRKEITLPKGAGTRCVLALNWVHEVSTTSNVTSPPRPAPLPLPTDQALKIAGVPGVSHYNVPLQLMAHGVLDLVIAQLDATDISSIGLGQHRPTAMHAIQALFDGIADADPLIESFASFPTLIQFPEFAFDISEWEEIDKRIRAQTNGPLILIAGFGPSTGESLRQWANATGPTQRQIALAQGETLPKMKTYNGGWCWVHNPTLEPSTRCYLFLKNYLEQREEPHLVTEVGKSILALEFDDLLLLPGICADFICEEANNPRERMRQAIQAHGRGKTVLITASLLDKTPWHSLWTSRLDSMVQLGANIVVSACNWAIDQPQEMDDEDAWRTRTGVFTARSYGPASEPEDPFIRRVKTNALLGGVARRSEPSILFGRVEWPPYGSATGRALWRNPYSYDTTAKVCHDSSSVPAPSAEAYEFRRFLRRRLKAEDRSGLDRLLTLEDEALRRLLRAVLNGPTSTAATSWNFDDDQTDPQDLLRWASRAMSLLSGTREFDWCGCADHDGQLDCTETAANILVWSGREGPQMIQRLREWTLHPASHPPLIAVAHAVDGTLDDGPVQHNAHTDITQTAPLIDLSGPSAGEDFTAVRPTRYAKIIRTGQIMRTDLPLTERLFKLREGVSK